MTPDAERWSGLDGAAARTVAAGIARDSGASLIEVGRYTYGGRERPIALFDVAGERFAFVPGGEVTVGYDVGRFRPAPDQVASFNVWAEEFNLTMSIRSYVDAMTSPARRVSVPPLLVSVAAVEAGARPVPPDHPEIVRLIREHRSMPASVLGRTAPSQIEWSGTGRATMRPDWTVEAAWLLDVPSYEDEVKRLAGLGQRLLTPDEWEHACGAGAPTLFRWGDHCPPGPEPYSASTGPHREPNAFGLAIGQDPYRDERTADPGVVCGGDGGGLLCGGARGFVAWFTLATAYRDAEYAAWLVEEADIVDQMFVRPAIELS